MAKRSFKQYTITAGGTPQPLVGTTLSAAAAPAGQDPNGDPALQNIAVADSSMFVNGDWAVIGTSAGGDEERVFVQSVPDGTHIKTKLTKSHANGVFVRLGVMCQAVYVQTKKQNTGSIFIGTQGMNKTGYVKVITELLQVGAGVQPIDWSDPFRVGQDSGDIADFFVDGTTNDAYLPSLTVN